MSGSASWLTSLESRPVGSRRPTGCLPSYICMTRSPGVTYTTKSCTYRTSPKRKDSETEQKIKPTDVKKLLKISRSPLLPKAFRRVPAVMVERTCGRGRV